MASFLIFAGAALLLLAIHPFTTYPASLAILAKWSRRLVAGGPGPATAALCVCAYNEERVIRAKALNMLALREVFPGLELLIYVDAGTDRTAEILAEFSDRIHVVQARGRTGKTVGMNTLIAKTTADCVVFSDANVMFDPGAVPLLLAPFADPEVGVVCGHLRYRSVPGSATAATGSLYWRLEEAIKQLESTTGSVMGADGSIFAMRRTMYRPAPPHLIDDMYVSLSALCAGSRIVRIGDALAYEDQVSRPAEEFRRKMRIACQAFNVHRALSPQLRLLGPLDRYKYVSHKLLRWFVAPLLAAGCLLLAAGLALASAWILLALCCAAGLGALVLPQSRAMLSAFAGTGLGVLHSLRGERFQTWDPPASTRAALIRGLPDMAR